MLHLLSFTRQMEIAKQQRESWDRTVRVVPARPWAEDMKFDKVTVIDAATWNPFRLVDFGVPVETVQPDPVRSAISQCGTMAYDEVRLPRAEPLDLATGTMRGKVVFNGDIAIPRYMWRERGSWELWMSYTPMEVATLRPALRYARGHVIIAGLGMGWLLTRVAARKQVTKITVVERNRRLVDWIMPALEDHLKGLAPVHVEVGDANTVVPKMTADVALWDIWLGIGNVDADDEYAMSLRCPNIKRTWFWGAHVRRPPSNRRDWW